MRLRGQAITHLAWFGIVGLLVVLGGGAASFYAIEGYEIKLRREELRAHYADQLVRLDSHWQHSAEQLLARIEFSRLLEGTDQESASAKLSAFLNAQWAFLDFPNIVILGANGEVRYRYGPIALAMDALESVEHEWHFVATHDELYREFRLPIWVGNEGRGMLILMRPLNTQTLRELVVPGVHLEAYVGKQEVVRSHSELAGEEIQLRHDTIGKLDNRFIEVGIDWPGPDSADKPTLKAYRQFSNSQLIFYFLGIAVLGVVALVLQLWFGMGRWLGITVRRIEAVDQALDDFAAGQLAAGEAANRLTPAHGSEDEISALAVAFEQMAATVEHRENEQRIYLDTLSILDEAVLDLDFEGTILHASPGWSRLCGQDDSVGVSLIKFVAPQDLERLREECAALRNGEKEMAALRLRLIGERGEEPWIEARFVGHCDSGGSLIAIRGVLRDISQSYYQEQKITHMALHDALTELPNRVLLEDRFKVALRLAKRTGHFVAICFLDLDNFKTINDTLGHRVGDALLVAFAENLRNELRSGDTLARWGGDEFVLLLPDMTTWESLREVTSKIVELAQTPLTVEGTEMRITFSMGATVFPADGEEMEQLFSQADRAMFYAKAQGRNQICFFSDMIDKGTGKRQLFIQNHLASAINSGRIQTWFQPLVCSNSGRCVGAEALARWHDDEHGWISPAQFIPMAENIGMIRELGRQAWLDSLAGLRAWRDAGFADLRLAVNVSKRQLFIASLPQYMVESLAKYGLAPGDVTIEVTESVALNDVEHAAIRLRELRGAGFFIAIDDFGTGYSSLSQLHEMPVDELKIDISFVRRIHDPKGLFMVQSIAQIARNLGLKTVAEGVEDVETITRLRELDIDILQGYYYGRPMPRDEFMNWLQER